MLLDITVFDDYELVRDIGASEPVFGCQIGKINLRVHHRSLCAGEYCSIHNPSQHPLRNAPLNWRADRGIMERFCSHGIGHPDPDDYQYRLRVNPDADAIHGCDGCCH